jgi:quinol monooxygenase YgiN
MIVKIAENRVKEGELPDVLSAIQKFVRAIRQNEPETFYEAYRRGDTFEFAHLMKFKDETAEKKHRKADHTSEFVSVLYPRCEIEPYFTDVAPIE